MLTGGTAPDSRRKSIPVDGTFEGPGRTWSTAIVAIGMFRAVPAIDAIGDTMQLHAGNA